MDITKFVVSGRESALLYGDHATYQSQLAKKLLNCRKKLNITTKNRGKYNKKDQVTAEQIGQNHEYLHLLLLTSERAWAQAMSMKSLHTTDKKGISGRTRSHIISRLDKAARTAEALVEILSQPEAGASRNDRLEAKAYAALIRGTAQTEKASWEPCLKSHSIARVIYSAMATSTKGDIFKDLISETLDISIRFSAHQLEMPRTIPIPTLARNAFPKSDTWLVQQINDLDPSILSQDVASKKDGPAAENAPRTLTWRSREVKIEDAAIALAWGQVLQAKEQLAKKLPSTAGADPKDVAGAYDDILTATQDAADATKEAIDEMREEGIAQSDPRMQSLQITRTAVNYEMISWRIGRNRVLTGDRDGAEENYRTASRKKAKKEETSTKRQKEATPSQKAAKLKEKVALYEGTLQSLESAKELPGVAADETLADQLDATAKYFNALKSLTIARSHAIAGNSVNALALINHAHDQIRAATPTLLEGSQPSANSPPNIRVTAEDAKFVQTFLEGELQRHRALVHIDNLHKESAKTEDDSKFTPLIDRLHVYPANGVDLERIVDIPPNLALVPVKPIFLDVAWNYIDYPGKEARSAPPKGKDNAADAKPKAEQQPQKKGWFGFGR